MYGWICKTCMKIELMRIDLLMMNQHQKHIDQTYQIDVRLNEDLCFDGDQPEILVIVNQSSF